MIEIIHGDKGDIMFIRIFKNRSYVIKEIFRSEIWIWINQFHAMKHHVKYKRVFSRFSTYFHNINHVGP
jgi:hypothetical protein